MSPKPVSKPAKPKLLAGFCVLAVACCVVLFTSFWLFTVESAPVELSENETLMPPPPPPGYPNISYDFDHDGKADIGRWHGANTEFKVKETDSGSFLTYTVGTSSAKAAPGNFDGSGGTDAGTFYNGTWKYKASTTASETTVSWGQSGDIPVPGNYDGTGATDFAVFRPSDNTWRIKRQPSGTESTTTFGSTGDIPVPGDYDGDGSTDLAHFRSSNGRWYLQRSTAGNTDFAYGQAGDVPLQGDFDADGKSDAAVYRPSTGVWYIDESGSSGEIQFTWGSYGDQPAPADYDGDGRTDFCVWRPTTGVWYIFPNPAVPNDPEPTIVTLGVPGDTAVPSAYTKQIAGTATGYDMAGVRLSPRNATGGTNLYSQNFSWGTSLVSLPGRSGMNAGFGIGYNSLVWAKVGSAMYFDPDASNVSPGFRFGFPVIEPVYYDSAKSKWAYTMVTPTGGRVEFRQLAASNTFDTADMSYTRLVTDGSDDPNAPVESITITVTTTDGTQMSYAWNTGAYRCIQIKDRNGNYITNTYSEYGLLTTMKDTLGRIVTVNYDSEGYPTSITQPWRGDNGSASTTTTHTWASFSYTTKTVDTDFHSSITSVFGPPDTTVVKVLEKITYADTSWTKFIYNSYLQVYKVENYADDDHKLNHTWINLETPSSAQQDCPRFTQTKTYAENFNSNAEVTVNNDAPTNSTFTGANGSENTSMVKVWVTGHPTSGFFNRIHFGRASLGGWKEGLTIATEDCTGDCTGTDRKRWTWNEWEQDVLGGVPYGYPVNPRISETRVGDGTNTKRTELLYHQASIGEGDSIAKYGLVAETRVYDTDLSTVLKKTVSSYNLGQLLVNRRIIGLPSQIDQYGGTTLVSKVTFAYDEGDDTSLSGTEQHDTTNYGTSLNTRGNLTSTKRWDVDYPTDTNKKVTTSTVYNIAGSPISTKDARDRETTISYTDNFNSSGNPTTYAYPKTITDPGGFSSEIKYRYDIGANVWAKSPTPYGASDGKTTERFYDLKGRLEKELVVNTGAYTEYAYDQNGKAMTSYTTVTDGGDSVGSADEVATVTEFDGAGRVIKTRTENPGTSGEWTGVKTEYDILGRVHKTTVPTEIDTDFEPMGDDASRGWVWNFRYYDWKDRVTRTVPSDSNGSDGKDSLFEYAGCGCAGGQVTTIKGPQIVGYNAAGNPETTAKRRMQKVYEDILGRTVKTEIYDFYENSPSTPYKTTTTDYNGRDQATSIKEYVGTTSGTMQETTMGYDAHGRLNSKHLPQWYGTSTSDPKYTTYTYNKDDSVATTKDPRGVETIYSYGQLDSHGTEDRALLTKIAYTLPSPMPSPSIVDVTDVEFTYDNAGNRLTMSDGTGTLAYTYDELSRLITETKDFADTLSGTPGGSGVYTLTYNYHLTGGIKSITDPYGYVVNYGVDKTGRTTGIGNSTSNTTAFATDIHHRAFGSIKSLSLSATDPVNISYEYDSALRPVSYLAVSDAYKVGPIQKASYTYHNDGLLQSVDAFDEDYTFDQENKYDFAGRLKKNDMGPNGYTFGQTMQYNAFDNLTHRTTHLYSFNDRYFTSTYANNRRVTGDGTQNWDNAGNVASSVVSGNHNTSWEFDAAGRTWQWTELISYGSSTYKGGKTAFDGDGRAVKVTERTNNYVGGQWLGWSELPAYYIYSSVTGQKITELTETGAYDRHNVYLGQSTIAIVGGSSVAHFQVTDPLTGSTRRTYADGSIQGDEEETRHELAALGTYVTHIEPQSYPGPAFIEGSWPGNPETACEMDNMPIPCDVRQGAQGRRKGKGGWSIVSILIIRKEEPTSPLYGPPGGDNLALGRWEGNEAKPISQLGKIINAKEPLATVDAEDEEDWLDKVSAGNGGGDGYLELPSDFRDMIAKRIASGDCNDFIANVIAKASEYTTLANGDVVKRSSLSNDTTGHVEPYAKDGTDLSSKVTNFQTRPNLKIGNTPVGGTVEGSLAQKNATVLLRARYASTAKHKRDRSRQDSQNYEGYVTTAIHEMVHLAGYYFNDFVLAQAVTDLGENTRRTVPTNALTGDSGTASVIFHDSLTKHCGEAWQRGKP